MSAENKKELEDIHRRLMSQPSKEDLEAMKLTVDIMEKAARMVGMRGPITTDPSHHHDSDNGGHHHDHAAVMEA